MKLLTAICFVFMAISIPAEIKLSVEPDYLEGLPGELLHVELRIETDTPCDMKLRLPHVDNLVLRAVERYPVARLESGSYMQKRLALFQGVAPGVCVITNISVEVGETLYCFPTLTIKVNEVEAVAPPVGDDQKESDSETP